MSGEATRQVRNTIVYLLTIVSTQVASFALLPLITRFLGPGSYGEYALALAVSGLLGTLASSWIRNVAFRYYFEARAANASRSFYWSLILLQAGAVLVAFGLGSVLLPLFSEEIVPLRTLWAAAAMVLASDFQAMSLAFVRAEQKSGRFAAAEITSALTRLAGTTVGLFMGLDQASFLLLAAAGASVLGGAVAFMGLNRDLNGPLRISFEPMSNVSRHLFGAMPFSVGEWIGNLSDRLVLNAFATTAAVGIYAAGFSLGDRIIGGLVMAVFMMAWPDVLARFNDGGYEAARPAIHRYFQIYLWLTTGPLVALIIFGNTIVALLGSAYVEAVQVIALVSGAAWIRGLSNGFNRHFELEKRFYVLSTITVAGSLANLALNLWLVPKFLAVGAGVSTLIAQSLMALVYIVLRERRLVSFPFRDLVGVLATSASVAGIAVMWLGSGAAAFFVFATGYALIMAVIWLRRIRGPRLGHGT